jgi:hypothetical protein
VLNKHPFPSPPSFLYTVLIKEQDTIKTWKLPAKTHLFHKTKHLITALTKTNNNYLECCFFLLITFHLFMKKLNQVPCFILEVLGHGKRKCLTYNHKAGNLPLQSIISIYTIIGEMHHASQQPVLMAIDTLTSKRNANGLKIENKYKQG